MKNTPAPNTGDLDIGKIKIAALLGAPLPGFDTSKKQEKQVIDSIFGELTFEPVNQFRDGTLRLINNDSTIIVGIDNESYKVVAIEITVGHGDDKESSVLCFNGDNTLSGDEMSSKELMQIVSALSREVLELRNQLSQLRETPTK
ncbi:hypothetical protein KBD33_01920 [Candidatus Gracilibacteria bacterium]|nr:hypothetical protein [Candidatus Gracilibacteria bacterium]